MKLIIFCISLIGAALLPWLYGDPSLERSIRLMVFISLGWGLGWSLHRTSSKPGKCTEGPVKTCYQVQAAAGRRLLPEFYDGEWEWSLGDENGRVSHSMTDARCAKAEALTCLPEAADDAIIVDVWCDCRR